MNDNNKLQKLKQEFLNFESETVGMKQELFLKRKQVEQLRKDIDAEKLKNHDLTQAINSHINKIDETTKSFNIALQNNQLLDNKLQEKIEQANKLKLQYDLVVTESVTLKELLHKSQMEKYDLLHKVEDLEEQNNRLQAFQKQLSNTDQKIISFITEVKKEVALMEENSNNLNDLAKEFKLSKRLYEQLVFHKNKVKNLENENQTIEKRATKTEAKYKKLSELLEEHKFLITDGVEFLKQRYDECLESHKNEIEFFKECIKNYEEKLKNLQEANSILILKNEDNYNIIDELKQALDKKLNVNNTETQTYEVLNIKQEQKDVIEID